MTTNNTGTYTLDDLLSIKNRYVSDFGVQAISDTFAKDLAYWNTAIDDQLGLLCEKTTENTLTCGTSTKVKFEEIDELGKAKTKKGVAGQNVSFPLKQFKAALGWDTKYIETATVGEMALAYQGVKIGYLDEIQSQIQKAIFNNANYSWVDSYDSGLTLSCKRFANNDGFKYPDSGTRSFSSTHNHYLARAGTLASTDVDGLVSTVSEHSPKGLMIAINYADRATFEALTGFKALSSVNMVYNASDATIQKANIEDDLENKLIGFYNDVPVWTKPFAVSNYWLCMATNADQKPLAFRQRRQPALQGLRMLADIPGYPWLVKNSEFEFGIAALNRVAASVLYIGGTTWANPTL